MRRLAALLLLVTPAAAEPALHRVVLSSGGMGQFEFEADVSGADALKLDVPLGQVDDVLKSLVVDDPAGPTQSVRLPGQVPLTESFRTLPFGPKAFASPEALLGSLVGERVRIASIGARGAILSVSPFDLPAVPGQIGATRHRLTIATDDGIVSVVLEDTPDIAFASETLRGQIASALAAIAAQRVQDRRTLTITLAAGAARHVRFGYVVAVPVWKTSYRLMLPADASQPARLEGFAVVENLSGRDWTGVSVTLTSGRPVLFHTPLYQPVFSSRPEAAIADAPMAAPKLDSFQAHRPWLAAPIQSLPRFAPPPTLAQPPPSNGGNADEAAEPPAPALALAPAAPPPASIAQSLAAVDFHLSAPVTAGSGQSLLLPIIARAIPARRVALFQPETDPAHPLVAVLLDNDSDGALPPGLVTLFDIGKDGQAGFVGDARLGAVAPGEQRLASFALDLAVTVDMQRHATQQVTGGSIAHGMLSLRQRARTQTDYTVTAPKSAPRTIVIEQAKNPDDPLVEPTGKAVTTTPESYRVTEDLPAGTTRVITLVTEHTTTETLALSDLVHDNALLYTGNTAIAEPVRQAIRHAADLRAAADTQKAALAALRRHLDDMTADQTRIRQNLFSIPGNSALQHRYVTTLQTQESELDDLQTRIAAGEAGVSAANAALAAYLADLNL